MTAEPLKPLQPRPYILPDFDYSGEIKRCPCCNGAGRVFVEDPKKGYSIFCHECGLMTPFLPIEHAIAAWNRREPFGNSDDLPSWAIKYIEERRDWFVEDRVMKAPEQQLEIYRDVCWIDALEWVLSLKKEE